MLLVSLDLLVAGSVVGALSSALFPMIVARALQGLASAAALMSASLGVGGALGLPVAAVVAEKADWHVLFWVSTALGAAALVLVVKLVRLIGVVRAYWE